MISLSHFLFAIIRDCIPMQRLQNSSDSLLEFAVLCYRTFFRWCFYFLTSSMLY